MTTAKGGIVSVFGSSRPTPDDPEYRLARELGKQLAAAGLTVCNGGYAGIMEASARGAKEAGGQTIGIVTDSFAARHANRWVDQVITEKSLIDRLMRLISIADAYVILKGGTGTLLEFAAVWEFMNKEIMRRKPCVAVGGFWNGVIHTLKDELAWEGLGDTVDLITIVQSPAECVRYLRRTLSDSTRHA